MHIPFFQLLSLKSMATLKLFGSLILSCLIVLLIPGRAHLGAFAQESAPAQPVTPILEPNKSFERGIDGPFPHVYNLKLTMGEYFRVAINQSGMTIEARLIAPDGRIIANTDNLEARLERIFLSGIVTRSGNYRLIVNPSGISASPARYTVSIEEQRPATQLDIKRVSADRVLMRAEQLKAQDNANSRRNAIYAFEEAFALWRGLGEDRLKAYSLANLAQLHESFNETRQALIYYQQELRVLKSLKDVYGEASTLNNIGLLFNLSGDKQRALNQFSRSLSLWQNISDLKGEALTLNNFGQTYASLGEREKALRAYDQALSIWRKLDERRWEAFTLTYMGQVHLHSGDSGTASDYYAKALKIWEDERDPFGLAYVSRKLDVIFPSTEGLRIKGESVNQQAAAVTMLLEMSAKPVALSRELEIWNQINTGNDTDAFELFLRYFPSSRFTDVARERLNEVRTIQNRLRYNVFSLTNNFYLSDELLPPRSSTVTTSSVERYPNIESPNPVLAETEFAVIISLTMNLVSPETKIEQGDVTKESKIKLPLPDKDAWSIDVVIMGPDFIFPEGNNAVLLLPKNGDSTPARIKLKSKAIRAQQQNSEIYAMLFYGNVYLGKIVRNITVIDPSVEPAPAVRGSTPAIQESRQESEKEQKISLDLKREGADLTITITDSPNTDQSQITITSDYLPRTPPELLKLPKKEPGTSSPQNFTSWLDAQYNHFFWLSSLLADLERKGDPKQESVRQTAKDALEGFGRTLYQEFAPASFQKAFCEMSRKHSANFKTIQIYSNNLDLPWELMRPVCKEGEKKIEHDFLGVEFVIARWPMSRPSEDSDLPPQSLLFNKIFVIAPAYKERELPYQQEELECLKLFSGYERIPGQTSNLRRLFSEFPQALIHFVGHGTINSTQQNVNQYSIQLEDGPLDLMTWSGMVNLQSKNHPILFFNACELGQTQRVAGFIDGWAPAALKAGASGYIGALWPVSDKGASKFGVYFYKTLNGRLKLGPASIADIVRETRKTFLQRGDPTTLAYIYFGDVNLKLRSTPSR